MEKINLIIAICAIVLLQACGPKPSFMAEETEKIPNFEKGTMFQMSNGHGDTLNLETTSTNVFTTCSKGFGTICSAFKETTFKEGDTESKITLWKEREDPAMVNIAFETNFFVLHLDEMAGGVNSKIDPFYKQEGHSHDNVHQWWGDNGAIWISSEGHILRIIAPNLDGTMENWTIVKEG